MRFVLFAVVGPAFAAEPVTSVWIRAAAAGGSARPEVHAVEAGEREVVIRSAGVSLHWLGPIQSRPPWAEQKRDFVFRIPRVAPSAGGGLEAGGILGAFANGLPIYSAFAGVSHRDRHLWHFDPARLGVRSELLDNIVRDGSRHSPILGYTLLGSPIYGPWALVDGELRRMRSSYRLRAMSRRTHWPNGLELTPAQEGPAPGPDAPLGTFAEDYEYAAGAGDLDEYNGRFARTPEYPGGVYAHFLSVDEGGELAYPYLVGEPVRQSRVSTVDFARTGDRLSWKLRAAEGGSVRRLEWAHEKPMHLLIVSDDLAEFAHVHPSLAADGSYAVQRRFAHGGRYHLYADFTAPGSAPRVEHRVLDVEGPRREAVLMEAASARQLRMPARLESGKDIEFRLDLDAEGLEPFLGAWGHFVIVDEGHRTFIHAHPIEEGSAAAATGHDHGKLAGPAPSSIAFAANFPRPGLYKLWAQSKRRGEVETIPFVLRVEAGANAEAAVPADAVRVDVTGAGFSPARLTVRERSKLAFVRSAEPNCGSRIVFPELGIDRPLAPGGVTVVELPVGEGTEVRFSCGMGMYRGAVRGLARTADSRR